MTDFFSLNNTAFATVCGSVDFSDNMHKQYKVVFDIYDRASDNPDEPRKYVVFINKRHLVSLGFWFNEDSKRSAIEYAKLILRRRFAYSAPPENAAFCKGKICEFKTVDIDAV